MEDHWADIEDIPCNSIEDIQDEFSALVNDIRKFIDAIRAENVRINTDYLFVIDAWIQKIRGMLKSLFKTE